MAPLVPGDRPDVVVVGGGPAGLVAALALRRHGFTVTVLERGAAGADKACGEGILPSGMAVLARLGIHLACAVPTRALRGVRYVDGPVQVAAPFPGAPGAGVRRTLLHQALATAAAAAGADLRWNTPAESVRGAAVRAAGRWLEPRYLVGADGLHSRVRCWSGLQRPAGRVRRYGIRRHYAHPPWSDHVEVHWAAGAEAYVTPVDGTTVGVAILWGGGAKGFDDFLDRFPALQARLAGVRPCSEVRGAGPLHQRVAAVQRGRVLLVGDAAGYLDAITGEGLSLAFRQAEALAASLARDRPAEYARAHRRLSARPLRLTRTVLGLAGRPCLRRRVLAALGAEPALFRRLVAEVAGDGKPRRLRPGEMLRLTRHLAIPRGAST